MNRRTVLRTVGLACVAGLGGCSGLSGSESNATDTRPASRPGSADATGTSASASDTASAGGDSTGTDGGNGDDATESETTGERTPESRSGTTLSGLAIDATPESIAGLGPYGRWVNQQPATVATFVSGLRSPDEARQFVAERLTPIWERGSIPIVTWMPTETAPPEDGDPLVDRRVASGEYDSIIETWADQLEAWALGPDGERTPERRVYFRPAHEMNGNWFPWSATDSTSAADYVEMWRRIYDVFADTALDETTIQWIWAPNADEVGDVNAEEYYPGDEYVDWIGLDGFNFGDVESWSDWQTPEAIFGGMLERTRELADKPTALTEFATTSYHNGEYRPERKAEWIEQAYAMIEREGIEMACWFDIDKEGTDESDWAVFGGSRGTASYTDLRTARPYQVYPEYKTIMNASWMLPARPEHPRLLTDTEFAGTR